MGNSFNGLRGKILRKRIKICVVGLGYVGLPLALEFAKKGFPVFGVDVDRDRINHIQRRQSYITDISTQELRAVSATGRFTAISDFKAVGESDCIIICVPTPLKRKYLPDISYIKQAVASIAKNIKPGTLVILESTTYPGTTEEVILPLLEQRGLKHGRDFYLCFSPERIDPGNSRYPVHKIPKIVGGITKQAAELGAAVYRGIIDKVVPVSSARTAEAVKLLENTFRLINIGLIDELSMMADKMKIDIWEVVEAAKTKPFGFMPFFPGPGVGGHCLDKNETVSVKINDCLKIMRMPDFIRYIQRSGDSDLEILSFDPLKKRSVFRKIAAASVRPYSGRMIDILTEDGRRLKVTDLHPMFIYSDNRWRLKYAKDLEKGDCLPVCLKLPGFNRQSNSIDIIEEIRQRGKHLIGKVRVKPVGFRWRDYAAELKSILRKENGGKLPAVCWDYLSDDILPLKYFYALDELKSVDRGKLRLVTGRGPGYSEMPARICLNEDFCRLIGYYLSEGCYTRDKSTRIRFSFNRSEKEYIGDVTRILAGLGIRTSIYDSPVWHTSCIKVSSDIFGFLIKEVLGCGRNCYDMNVPERIFSLDIDRKKALLSGVFRGDASVEHFFGKWRYRRNEKEYFHNVNTANISFFTSSQRLFRQLTLLLHDLNILPTFRKRRYSLSIFGYKQLALCRDLFDGRKKEIIERYLTLNKNRPRNKTFKKKGGFATVKVKSVASSRGDWVYSVETEKPHSFVTSYGIVVHNCIPKDPLYLYWKAKKFGFKSRFIKLASDVISNMPEYVVRRVRKALSKHRRKLPEAKILVIGVTYKKNVKDLRKSPALDIIEILQKNRARVAYYDPLIPYLKFHDINLKSVRLNAGDLSTYDCVIIATDHSSVDYGFILNNSRLIFDTRNVYKGVANEKISRL